MTFIYLICLGFSSDVANLGKNLLTIFNTALGNFLDQKDNWQDYCKRNTIQQTIMDKSQQHNRSKRAKSIIYRFLF